MTAYYIRKKTSTGSTQLIGTYGNADAARAEMLQLRYQAADNELSHTLSPCGRRLVCANDDTSSLRITYELRETLTGEGADRAFRRFCLNRDSFALAMLKYRNFDGFFVSGQNSGTQWVKWMMSHALAHHYNVTPPRYFDNKSSNDIIGHPRHPQLYPQIPHIVSTHSVAPYVLGSKLVRKLFPLPHYALLVRDIRPFLISHYEKWRFKYKVSFSQYIAGDPQANAYYGDVWWYIRFLNRWGDVASRYPAETFVTRYEDVQKNRAQALRGIFSHFGIALSDEALQAGAHIGAKDVMAAYKDPTVIEDSLRPDGRGDAAFTAADEALLDGILDRHLKHDFGYRYFSQPRGFQG